MTFYGRQLIALEVCDRNSGTPFGHIAPRLQLYTFYRTRISPIFQRVFSGESGIFQARSARRTAYALLPCFLNGPFLRFITCVERSDPSTSLARQISHHPMISADRGGQLTALSKSERWLPTATVHREVEDIIHDRKPIPTSCRTISSSAHILIFSSTW